MAESPHVQVLIVTGQLSAEHDPKTSQLLRRMLESTGRFSVRITEEFRGASAETLSHYDLVILNYDGGVPGRAPVALGRQAEQALVEFVRLGKGIVFHHSAVWTSAWPQDFLQLMGGYCDPALGSRKNPITDFAVNICNSTHPVTAGLPPRWNTVQDDLFAGVVWHEGAQVEVLATVFDDIEGYRSVPPHIAFMIPEEGPETMKGVNEDHAVAWTNRFGEGRVFAISIGHGIDTIRRPGFVALYCRAAEWAATGIVTLAPPDLSGDNRRRVWPYYCDLSLVEAAALTP
jgi:type 1 glutamine amidotransferase